MFRPLIVAALLALTVLAPTSAVAQTPVTDEAAVRALVEAYSAARDRSDAAALTALFTADADQLVSSGEWRRGREAVVTGSLTSSQQAQGRRTFTIDTVRMSPPTSPSPTRATRSPRPTARRGGCGPRGCW